MCQICELLKSLHRAQQTARQIDELVDQVRDVRLRISAPDLLLVIAFMRLGVVGLGPSSASPKARRAAAIADQLTAAFPAPVRALLSDWKQPKTG